MKVVNFNVEDVLSVTFRERLEQDNCTSAQVLRAAMLSYSKGDLVLRGPELVPTNTGFHVEPTKRPVGRPITIKEKEPQSKGLPDWYAIDHRSKSINTYPLMYQEPHPSSDPRAHLDWETQGQISGNTFQELCYDNYLDARFETTYRKWQGGGLEEFVQRCAMKFFAINRLQTLRFEAMDLQEGMFKMEEAFEPQITMAYDGGVLNDEDPK